MAASNWDTLALTMDSEVCDGYVENNRGVSIEIYKNWLYIHDPAVKQALQTVDNEGNIEHRHFGHTGDVIMKMDDGNLVYGGWQIHARRGPQNGVYVVAYSPLWYDPVTTPDAEPTMLIGCGVYGYENVCEKYYEQLMSSLVLHGFDPEEVLDHDIMETSDWNSKDGRHSSRLMVIPKLADGSYGPPVVVLGIPDEDPEFVGVLPSPVEFLQQMATEIAGEEYKTAHDWPGWWLRNIIWDNARRYNQGDLRYFGGEGTRPGEVTGPTTFQQVLDHMFGGVENESSL